MDITRILVELKAERDHIDRAIAALGSIGARQGRRGRAAGRSTSGGKRRKRRLTPEGRKRLSEMMKKRWAERRKNAKAA